MTQVLIQTVHLLLSPVTQVPDPNCAPPSETQGEGNCIDGIDNDGDGFPDKSDPDCNEDCFDEIDNDGDGFIDDIDEDCGGNNGRGNPGLPPVDPAPIPPVNPAPMDQHEICDSNTRDPSPSCEITVRDSDSPCHTNVRVTNPSCDVHLIDTPPSCDSNLGCSPKLEIEKVVFGTKLVESLKQISTDHLGTNSLFATASSQEAPSELSARNVYVSKNLKLDSNVKTFIILMPDLTSIESKSTAKDYFHMDTTIAKGTSIRWINADPAGVTTST